MPFRIDEHRSKIQFTSSAEMPYLIYRACIATGTVSNTVYLQHAVVAALARDLGLDPQPLLDALPPARGSAAALFNPSGGHPMDRYTTSAAITVDPTGGTIRIGPGNTVEEVK